MANNPNVRANLRPPWTSETAPKGRKNAGLSVTEWRNELAGWELDEIAELLRYADASAAGTPQPGRPRKITAAQIVAAREIMQAVGGDKDARRDLCDYTGNKPTSTNVNLNETVHVRRTVVHVRDGLGEPNANN